MQIDTSEDSENRDLAVQSPVCLCNPWTLEESLVTGDCGVFVYYWRSAICNAEVVVTNIEEVP